MKKYLKRGVGLVGANIMVGAMPNISGSASETTMKDNFSTGLTNVGKTLPLQGSVMGTSMVMKSMGKLTNHKMIKQMKGGRKKK